MRKQQQPKTLLEKYRFFLATKILLKFDQIQTSVQEKSYKLKNVIEIITEKHFRIKHNHSELRILSQTGRKTYEQHPSLLSFKNLIINCLI